jgi:hypothetical protein
MASDTDANDISDTDTRFHEDHEWEAQRDNFLQFYKDQKMTLKAATQSMIDCYGFYATPRQWERKISSWGVKKYTSRSERMHQIESQGRTLVEIAATGRRPRQYSNSNNLEVDDRNIRRFARRALGHSSSRSSARSRSSSAGQRSPCLSPRQDGSLEPLVVGERDYELDVSVLMNSNNPSSIPAVLPVQNSDNPQAHVMEVQDPSTGQSHTELYIDFPAPVGIHNATSLDKMVPDLGFEAFPPYDTSSGTQPHMTSNRNALNIETNLSQNGMFEIHQTEAMDVSPTNSQQQSQDWQVSEAISMMDMNTSFANSTPSGNTGFEQNLLTPVQSNEYDQSMMGQISPMTSVPTLLVSPVAPTPGPYNATPAVGLPVSFTPVPLQNDPTIDDPYPDFTKLVYDYAAGVEDTFRVLFAGRQLPDVAAHQLQQYKSIFVQQMNKTLNNLVMSAQRTIRSGVDANRILRQRIIALENRSKFQL